MHRARHTIARFATTGWLLVCLLAPHLAALASAGEERHSCCRNKSSCCCRNRTGKSSALIGDRKECARTCGLPSLAAGVETLLPAAFALVFCFATLALLSPLARPGFLHSSISINLFERPPPLAA